MYYNIVMNYNLTYLNQAWKAYWMFSQYSLSFCPLIPGTIIALWVYRILLGPHEALVLQRRAHPGLREESAFSGTWVPTWSACGCWCCGCDAAACMPALPYHHPFTASTTREDPPQSQWGAWTWINTFIELLTLFCSGCVSLVEIGCEGGPMKQKHPAKLCARWTF